MVFTSTSGGPTSAAIRSTTLRAAAGSVGSAASRRMPSGSSFSASSLRSTSTAVNPAAASFPAAARPSSPPAPTTMATRSLMRFSFRSMNGPGRSGRVQLRHREGDKSSPDSGDLPAIYTGYADRVPGGDGAMTDMPAAGGRAAGPARPGLIDRHDLVAALDRAVAKPVTIISAPAGSGKTSLLHAWADRPGQYRRIAFMSVRPDQHDGQLFWLALLSAIRAATGAAESPPAAPGFNGPAMVDKVRSELTASGGPFVLIIDDLHELSSAEAAEQLTTLLTTLPPGVHAIVATRRDLPLRLHQLRLAGELAEIRD